MIHTIAHKRRFLLFLISLILWTSLILLFSFSTGTQSTEQSNFVSNIILKILDLADITLSDLMINELHLWVRKLIGHFGMFLVDGFLAYFALFFGVKKKTIHLFLLTVGFGIFVAAFSEVAQLFTPDRAGLFLDVVIDLIGFSIGSLAALFLSQWKRYKPKTTGMEP